MVIASLYNLKGGVGKTASCVNLAHLASSEGYRTLLWDLDPQGAASFYFGAEGRKGAAKKLVEHTLNPVEAAMPTEYEGLSIIPADLSARKMDLLMEEAGGSRKQLKSLMKPLAKEYDIVFLDCPPGFSVLAEAIFHASDAILMPVVPTTLSVRTYEIVTEHLSERAGEVDKLACFFTLADSRKAMHNDVMKELSRDRRFFQHYIPYLSDVEKMGLRQAPVTAFAPSSYAAICYQALWDEMKEGLLG